MQKEKQFISYKVSSSRKCFIVFEALFFIRKKATKHTSCVVLKPDYDNTKHSLGAKKLINIRSYNCSTVPTQNRFSVSGIYSLN